MNKDINFDNIEDIIKANRAGIDSMFDYDIEKGVYKDNAENRKLGRAGKTYGGKKEGDDKKEDNKSEKDNINKSEQEDINKGGIYGIDRNMEFEKKGIEIKEKLINLKSIYAVKIGKCKARMEAYRTAITVDPKGDSYLSDDNMPEFSLKVYTYEQKFPKNDGTELNDEQNSTSEEDKKAMYKYNDEVYNIKHLVSDARHIQTLINNLSDNKTYKLSGEQLKMMGF